MPDKYFTADHVQIFAFVKCIYLIWNVYVTVSLAVVVCPCKLFRSFQIAFEILYMVFSWLLFLLTIRIKCVCLLLEPNIESQVTVCGFCDHTLVSWTWISPRAISF